MDNKELLILKQALKKNIEEFETKTGFCIEEIVLNRRELTRPDGKNKYQLTGITIRLVT